MQSNLSAIILLGACAVGLFAAARVVRLPNHVVAIGDAVRQDDFEYTVEAVSKSKQLTFGSRVARAAGTFYLVTVRVDNRALRVPYRWDPGVAYVVDANAESDVCHYDADAQRLLEAQRPQDPTIEAGMSSRFRVVFDVPARIGRPELAYSNGIMMGDIFNAADYTRARVPL